MSEKFRSQLDHYANGTLSMDEQQELEQELAKLDIYQQYLDEMVTAHAGDEEKDRGIKKIIKKAKQKSLFSTVLTTVCILLLGNLALQQLSNVTGNSSLEDMAMMDAAIHLTIPNVSVPFSSQGRAGLFQRNHLYDLERRIGNERIYLGELSARFRFNTLQELHLPRTVTLEHGVILYPTSFREGLRSPESFDYLEQLPEETMAEVYISFNQFMTTEDVFELFRERDISLDWLAVYTGGENIWDEEFDLEVARIGFPNQNYSLALHQLHLETMQIENGVENEGECVDELCNLRNETFCEDDACLIEQRQNHFMFALGLLAENSDVAEQFIRSERGGVSTGWPTDFNVIYDYISENGIQIPGVVVTGPTADLLALRDEPWILQIHVNDVTFLNWTSLLED